MVNVLEKLGGERVLLVCEKNSEILPNSIIRLKGNEREFIIDDFQICKQRNCFSKAKTMNIMLPPKYRINDLRGIKEIEIVE